MGQWNRTRHSAEEKQETVLAGLRDEASSLLISPF